MTDWPQLRDYGRSRAVIMGTWEYSALQPVPAARRSWERFSDLLAGPLCGWPRDRMLLLADQRSPGNLADRLVTAFEDITDVALFYYVGHGQIDNEDQLCLALGESRPEPHRRAATSLQWADVRRALAGSRAATKIVILDCCFAAAANRPGSALAGPYDDVLAKSGGTGAYTMAASNAYGAAWFETNGSPRARQTYFTKYLVDIVEAGLADQPAELRLHQIFTAVRDRLAADHKPVPESRNVNFANDFVFAYNAAPPAAHYDPESDIVRLRQLLAESEARNARTAPPPHRPPSGPPAVRLRSRQPWAGRRRAAGLAAAALLVAALAAVGLTLLPRSPGTAAAATVSYQLSPSRFADGLTVAREWTLSGPRGVDFRERLSISNNSGRVVRAELEEAVPAFLARGIASIRLSAGAKVIDQGRQISWPVRVAGHGQAVLGYHGTIAPGGVTTARLSGLAKSYGQPGSGLVIPGSSPVRLASLTIRPGPVRLTAGEAMQLTVTGAMSNGGRASGSLLATARWTSADPAVARVSRLGRVTAVAPGKTKITVVIGAVHAWIRVEVTAVAPDPGSSYQSPGAGTTSHPPAKPSPQPTTTLTPSPI
jgi:hypothetical protein